MDRQKGLGELGRMSICSALSEPRGQHPPFLETEMCCEEKARTAVAVPEK